MTISKHQKIAIGTIIMIVSGYFLYKRLMPVVPAAPSAPATDSNTANFSDSFESLNFKKRNT